MNLFHWSLIAAIGLTLGVCWLDFPLGVPGEWTWSRLPFSDDLLWEAMPLSFYLLCLAVITWCGRTRIEGCRAWQHAFWLGGMTVAGFFVLTGLRDISPPAYRSAKAAWVLYYPGSSGYFTEASRIRDLRSFLALYEQEMQKGEVLHQGTHPPGLIVGFRGLIWICSQSISFRQMVLMTQPQEFQEFLKVIADHAFRTGRPFTEVDRCVLWLAAVVVQVCAAATILPLYGLLRLYVNRRVSWQYVSLWPLVPALTIFQPKSDVCFAFLGCVVLACWFWGLRRQSHALCALAGAFFWLGMTLSLALLPIGFLAALMTLWNVTLEAPVEGRQRQLVRVGQGIIAGGLCFIGLTWMVWWFLDCNLVIIWAWNYRNHAGFYAQYTRTYWCWLLINPVELIVAVGFPVFFTVCRAIWRSKMFRATIQWGPTCCSSVTWALLWLSGKNMGEAARLWVFLMPWFIWSAGSLDRTGEHKSAGFVTLDRDWGWIWTIQAICAALMVSRVVGFHALSG